MFDTTRKIKKFSRDNEPQTSTKKNSKGTKKKKKNVLRTHKWNRKKNAINAR